jgi:hypothetical protein
MEGNAAQAFSTKFRRRLHAVCTARFRRSQSPIQVPYDNFIGGKWVAPVKGEFDVITPITGKPYTQAARSGAEDVELALDAAHAAADKWGRTPAPSAPTCC